MTIWRTAGRGTARYGTRSTAPFPTRFRARSLGSLSARVLAFARNAATRSPPRGAGPGRDVGRASPVRLAAMRRFEQSASSAAAAGTASSARPWPGLSHPIRSRPTGAILWCAGGCGADPALAESDREKLVSELMAARARVGVARRSGDRAAEQAAHVDVDHAKRALGERGPVWWTDGSPDFNRHMVRNTPYADWFAALG